MNEKRYRYFKRFIEIHVYTNEIINVKKNSFLRTLIYLTTNDMTYRKTMIYMNPDTVQLL